jgi:hypothetical protein
LFLFGIGIRCCRGGGGFFQGPAFRRRNVHAFSRYNIRAVAFRGTGATAVLLVLGSRRRGIIFFLTKSHFLLDQNIA